MIHFLVDFDNRDRENIPKTLAKIRGENIGYLKSPNLKKDLIKWIKGANNAINNTKKNDCIFCWYDFQAVLLFLMCKLRFAKRNILAMNIMLKEKDSLKNAFVANLYGIAFRDKSFFATVNSAAYGKELQKRFRLNRTFPVIHDPFVLKCIQIDRKHDISKTILTGGGRGRDWDTVYRVAKIMPDFHFILVRKDIPTDTEKYTFDNIEVRARMSHDDFRNLLYTVSFLLVPVDNCAPAGLMTMFDAASRGKVVVMNSTVVTEEFLGEGRGLLIDDGKIETYAQKIRDCYENPDLYYDTAEKLQNFLLHECDIHTYCTRINECLNALGWS